MEFCPECGTVMFPKDDKFTCQNCGFTEEVTEESKSSYNVSEELNQEETVIVTDNNINTLPTIKAICPKCGNKLAFWWLQQTRRADESETRFLRCTECEYTWREYD
ncbi:MAG: transcription factor S [Methanobacteriaceae archaeon]|nr:transcription factor S [Methanobacteriaceae archaeon]